jgi:hypothetical protein
MCEPLFFATMSIGMAPSGRIHLPYQHTFHIGRQSFIELIWPLSTRLIENF